MCILTRLTHTSPLSGIVTAWMCCLIWYRIFPQWKFPVLSDELHTDPSSPCFHYFPFILSSTLSIQIFAPSLQKKNYFYRFYTSSFIKSAILLRYKQHLIFDLASLFELYVLFILLCQSLLVLPVTLLSIPSPTHSFSRFSKTPQPVNIWVSWFLDLGLLLLYIFANVNNARFIIIPLWLLQYLFLCFHYFTCRVSSKILNTD